MNPTVAKAEQEARFERFCNELIADAPRSTAYRAALRAGYTLRMAKSKSYLLARRARKVPGFRKAWNRAADEYAVKTSREYYESRGRVLPRMIARRQQRLKESKSPAGPAKSLEQLRRGGF